MNFIYGTENFLIENETTRIIKKLGLVPIVFDETSTLSDLLLELEIIPMFEEKKFIIFKNINAFKKEDEAAKLVQVLKNSKDIVSTIFVLNEEKPKTTNSLVKYLMDNANTNKFDQVKEKDIFNAIKQMVENKNGTITNKAAIVLAAKLPNDLQIINNEVSKLIMENEEITDVIVEKSISSYLKDDFFGLANALVSKDSLEIIKTFNNRINNGAEPIAIISSIASTLLLASNINNYKEMSMSLNEISTEMSIHIFRIKKSNELLLKAGSNKIKELLIKLSELDTNIKTGFINPKIGLDQFILNYIK